MDAWGRGLPQYAARTRSLTSTTVLNAILMFIDNVKLALDGCDTLHDTRCTLHAANHTLNIRRKKNISESLHPTAILMSRKRSSVVAVDAVPSSDDARASASASAAVYLGAPHQVVVAPAPVLPAVPSAPASASKHPEAPSVPPLIPAEPPVAAPLPLAVLPAPAVAPVPPVAPLSPGRNRQLFIASMTPQHMTCDLGDAVVGQGVKHNLIAIVIACFPIQNGPPARRHIMVRDSHGCTGLTVWHADVHKFPKEILGGVITITRASVSMYQGKKNLVLSKESTVHMNTVSPSPMADWWASLARQPPLPLPSAVIAADNSVINVFGVLAFVSNEVKLVNGLTRRVTSVHMVSPTAKFQLRGWDLEDATLQSFALLTDKIVNVSRVRISSFAEIRVGDFMESPLGTSVVPYHDAELQQFWDN